MTLKSCEGTVLASSIGSTFDDGSGPIIETVCLTNSLVGLKVEVGGGSYPEDASWSLTFPSGFVETGTSDPQEVGSCTSPRPSHQPSATMAPTAACDYFYTIELSDLFGDG